MPDWFSLFNYRKRLILYYFTNSFCCNESLVKVLHQARNACKLFATKTCRRISRPQRLRYAKSDFLNSFTSRQMPIRIIYVFEIIYIHHQNAKWLHPSISLSHVQILCVIQKRKSDSKVIPSNHRVPASVLSVC